MATFRPPKQGTVEVTTIVISTERKVSFLFAKFGL